MNPEQTTEIAKNLNRISKILAALLLRDIDENDQARKVLRLASCGFSNNEIAEFVGTTADVVRVTINRAKKSKKR